MTPAKEAPDDFPRPVLSLVEVAAIKMPSTLLVNTTSWTSYQQNAVPNSTPARNADQGNLKSQPRSPNQGVPTEELQPRSPNQGVPTEELQPRSPNRGSLEEEGAEPTEATSWCQADLAREMQVEVEMEMGEKGGDEIGDMGLQVRGGGGAAEPGNRVEI
ncbi:hypothetical protein KC19_3G224500 [Ceratodon purpureus]|uniref:Uncharacterized protein n=1 Tax=Ceratodon purpureus TaxID=3225 RepID=A0A8T0INP5_CERPU|nr:hypothetical protein KC19_3G224500 [Ceratodon purpureus]